ncbi:DUF222 domain-containing protein [Geodermatophilus sp. SYSU D00691]
MDQPPAYAAQTGLAAGPLGVVQAADREIARQTAVRARALAEFAASRPASADRAQGEPGAMSAARWAARPDELKPVSEWATPELSIGLTCTRSRADALLSESLLLVERLPGTLAALEAGMLTEAHRWPLLEHVATVVDDRVRAEVETEVLGWVADRAARRTITTPPQLRDKVLRVLARRNLRDVADELARAVKRRGVHLQPEKTAGMAAVFARLTVPEAQALVATLEALAGALPADPADTRSRGEKMADVLLDLVLRRGSSDLPPVQVALTLVAPVSTVLGGDAPAELGGQVVPAEVARRLLDALAGAGPGAPADEPPAADLGEDEQFPDLGLDDSGWTERMRAAHAEWEADWERRLEAGEFDDPDPLTADEVVAAAERTLDEGWLELQREMADADDRWWAEFEAGLHPDPDPPPADGPAGTDPPEDGTWWRSADRAVQEAERILGDAEAALVRARDLVHTAELADRADEAAWQRSPAGRVTAAADALGALRAAAAADRAALGDLLVRTGGGGLLERPRIALVDALSGTLVSLTDLPGLRRAAAAGEPLGAPEPTDGYRPGAELDRFVRRRDRRCRFPGCRRPVAAGELDHRIRWPDGPTDVGNLVGFCTGDHRGKHQAPGLDHALDAAGTLTVTTPSGLVATTDAPPF